MMRITHFQPREISEMLSVSTPRCVLGSKRAEYGFTVHCDYRWVAEWVGVNVGCGEKAELAAR
eukprot:5087439-Prorocentrum_lima.AAC.1